MIAMAADIVHSDTDENCVKYCGFNETAELSCGHTIPLVSNANAAHLLQGTLKLYPGFANRKSIFVVPDSGANLIRIRKNLVRNEDYTDKYVCCRTFSGNRVSQTSMG